MLDTFLYSKCYEWVLVLAIVLKKFSAISDVMRLVKLNEISPTIADSLKNGVDQLDQWTTNEWYTCLFFKINFILFLFKSWL